MNYQRSIATAFEELLQAQKEIGKQIASYPNPISGCDAQFNGLLSDRVRVLKAIKSLESHPFIPTPRQLEPGEPRASA